MAEMPKRFITGWQQWCPVRTATPSESSCVPISMAETGGSSITNEITDPLRAAVPMIFRPGTSRNRSVA